MGRQNFQWLNFRFRCRLKNGVGFHLFITTSPCGDARIFSLHESSSTNNLESKVKLSDIESAEQKEEVVKEEEETKDEDIDDEIKDDVDDSTSITSGSVNSADEVCEMAADDNLKDHVEEFVKVEEPKEVLEDENNNISEDLKENAKQINYGNLSQKMMIIIKTNQQQYFLHEKFQPNILYSIENINWIFFPPQKL